MSKDIQADFGRLSVSVAVAAEPWWVTSPAGKVLGVGRTYLLLGFNVHEYPELYVFSLHLVLAQISVAWRREMKEQA